MGSDITNVTVQLKELLASNLDLNVPVDDIRDDHALMADGLGLDSIGLIELITLVETNFQIRFSEEDLTTTSFESVASLSKVISRHLSP